MGMVDGLLYIAIGGVGWVEVLGVEGAWSWS